MEVGNYLSWILFYYKNPCNLVYKLSLENSIIQMDKNIVTFISFMVIIQHSDE